MLYGEGVYAEMLFSSQRNTDNTLQTLLDNTQTTEAKKEIVDVVTKAFVESDGISIDTFEAKIQAEIGVLAGKGWDIQKNAPAEKSGSNGRRKNSTGLVLDAYYAWEDARAVCQKIADLEEKLDQTATGKNKADEAMEAARKALDDFNKYFESLNLRNTYENNISRYKADLCPYKRADSGELCYFWRHW